MRSGAWDLIRLLRSVADAKTAAVRQAATNEGNPNCLRRNGAQRWGRRGSAALFEVDSRAPKRLRKRDQGHLEAQFLGRYTADEKSSIEIAA